MCQGKEQSNDRKITNSGTLEIEVMLIFRFIKDEENVLNYHYLGDSYRHKEC